MALMAAKGEIEPMPQAAIFADTQAEPQSVYEWLDWLEQQLPFPVYRVTHGDLAASEMNIRTSQRSGRRYRTSGIPMFMDDPNAKSNGMIRRKCTRDYKIYPIIRKVRELAEITRGQKEVTVTQWIGISWDEMTRMKDASDAWCQNRWPLIERRMTRTHCFDWMRQHGYPEPPRSACVFCPYHSDREWKRLRDEEPKEFEKACEFEDAVREVAQHDEAARGTPYLHASRRPLREVNFDGNGQMEFGFADECDGMCGV